MQTSAISPMSVLRTNKESPGRRELHHQKVGKEFLSKPQEEVMMHASRNTPRGIFYSDKSQGNKGSQKFTFLVIPLVLPYSFSEAKGKHSIQLSIA